MQFIFGHYHSNTISAIVDTMSMLLCELVTLSGEHLLLDGGCQQTRSLLQCITVVHRILVTFFCFFSMYYAYELSLIHI